jgi:UDP-hydrolysing UDP-N-acetyl-D-glucosamine 2-epimerase
MGEEPWRITVSGAPGLDNLASEKLMGAEELQRQFGIPFDPPPLLVTFHPVTLEYEQAEWQIGQLLDAVAESGHPAVFTLPNADTNSRSVIQAIRHFVAAHPTTCLVDNFGAAYASAMSASAAMVGNSSSGIIEAASFGLPVVNVGTRQNGRVRPINVIDVGYPKEDIREGIRRAMDPAFRTRLRAMKNPYGDGHASDMIVSRLKEVALDQKLIRKIFCDLNGVHHA